MRKVCFVISPIGEKDSKTRLNSDLLYKLIISRALEKYNFKVIRADMMPSSERINLEVLDAIRKSDLCIIDLTDHNPNVYFEYGIRHEAHKPFIQMITDDQTIPFDLQDIRTVRYNLSSPIVIDHSIDEIQAKINVFEAEGYGRKKSSTIESLTKAIREIDRKIDRAIIQSPQVVGSGGDTSFPGKVTPEMLQTPREAFSIAIRQGDIPTASRLLSHLEKILVNTTELISYASQLAAYGNANAADIVRRELENEQQLDYIEFRTALGALVHYYHAIGSDKEGVHFLEPLVDKRIERDKEDLTNKEQAYLINQVQRIKYHTDDTEASIRSISKVLELCPDDESYVYNAALLFSGKGDKEKTLELVLHLMTLDNLDDDHLSFAIRILAENNQCEDVKKHFKTLHKKYPDRASEIYTEYTQVKKCIDTTSANKAFEEGLASSAVD